MNSLAKWETAEVQDLSVKLWIGLVTTMTKNYVEKGTPLIRNSDIKDGYITKNKLINLNVNFSNQYKNRAVTIGDIVTVHTGDVGTSALIDADLDGAQGFATINTRVDNSIISNQYLVKYYNSAIFKQIAYKVITGDGRDNLNMKDFVHLIIKFPPLPHQRKIARILTTVDNVIETTESAIAKYKAIKQGMMHDLFTRGIDTETGKLRPTKEEAPHLYKNTELGWIPKEWEVERLGNIATFSQGLQVDVDKQFKKHRKGLIRFIRIIDYTQNIKEVRFIQCCDKRYYVNSDDIVMVRYGIPGLIGRKISGVIANNMFKILFDNDISNDYAEQYFLYPSTYDRIQNGNSSTTMPAINFEFLSKLLISYPSIKNQNKIAELLKNLDNKIETEQKQLAKLQKLKQGLMQDLLTGKKEVEPDKEDYDE